MGGFSGSGIAKWILLGFLIGIVITGTMVVTCAAAGGNPTLPGNTRTQPIATATPTPAPTLLPVINRNVTVTTPTPTPLPLVVRANASLAAHLNDGFYTSSQLMYVISPHNITVVEADTNKVVDVIYLDKDLVKAVAVAPDYSKLYVLYSAHADAELSETSPYDDSYYAFLLTIDLYTKQVVADTWYMGDYFDLIYGSANKLVISPDGRYLYFAANSYDKGMIFQYDTVLNKYTRGIEVENAWDLTVSPDGKSLYYVDAELDLLYVLYLPSLTVNGYFYTMDIDMEPMSMAVNSQQTKFFMAGNIEGKAGWGITYIDRPSYDLAQKTGETTWEFSDYVEKVRMGPDQQRLFVMQSALKQILAYVPDQPWDYSTYPTDGRPWDFGFGADGTKIEINSAMRAADNKSLSLCVIPVPKSWLARTYDKKAPE
jgi:hypothetical protein